jgi:cysteinyl-tRNA synthetase
MKLYNTLTRSVEELAPLNPPKVTLYTCGLTVYDYAHIGNWFAYLRWDLLVRALKANGLQPLWVENITDVGHLVSDADDGEDKLEKGARREGKTAWEVAAFYTDYYLRGMKKLNMLMPDHMPKATDHIPEQIELIKTLEEKGFTYVISDGVYFDTSKFPAYAAFARLDLDDQQAGARVEYNTEKRNPSDFALWKFSPESQQRDMEWDSPFGNGRKGFPGWHIECSAMSMKYLGETLDIHTGGIDHIPVHHTNEIAQSEAATGKRFANMWLHSNHITVEGEKISKSLGNGIKLEDIEERGIPLAALRLHVAESHYRSQSKFSWESLEATHNRLKHWLEVAALAWQTLDAAPLSDDEAATYKRTVDAVEQALSDLPAALANDLDTPAALALLDQTFSQVEATLIRPDSLHSFKALLRKADDLLGLDLSLVPDISNEQRTLIQKRAQARDAKDWQQSDELRGQLAEQRIGIRDTPHGQLWYPI